MNPRPTPDGPPRSHHSAPARSSRSSHGPTPSRRTLARVGQLWSDESGGTHIEYALIGGFTGVLLMGGLLSLQDGLNNFYNGLASILSTIL